MWRLWNSIVKYWRRREQETQGNAEHQLRPDSSTTTHTPHKTRKRGRVSDDAAAQPDEALCVTRRSLNTSRERSSHSRFADNDRHNVLVPSKMSYLVAEAVFGVGSGLGTDKRPVECIVFGSAVESRYGALAHCYPTEDPSDEHGCALLWDLEDVEQPPLTTLQALQRCRLSHTCNKTALFLFNDDSPDPHRMLVELEFASSL